MRLSNESTTLDRFLHLKPFSGFNQNKSKTRVLRVLSCLAEAEREAGSVSHFPYLLIFKLKDLEHGYS